MSLLRNRLRTITGEDASFFRSAMRLLYYTFHRKRFGALLSKMGSLLGKADAKRKQREPLNRQAMQQQMAGFAHRPSIYIYVYGTGNAALTSNSLLNQVYAAAEVIFDHDHNAIPQAPGGFALLLDAGDTLSEDCLFEAVKLLNSNPQLRLIYTDEADTGNHKPYPKPGWSPDALRSENYIRHAFMHHSVLGAGQAYADAQSQTYALLLAHAFARNEVAHIPHALMQTAPKAADRINPESFALKGEPLISIIIPTRNKSHLVKQCIRSIIERTAYQNFELILVDNRSDEAELADYIHELEGYAALRFKAVKADMEFNFSALMNLGVQHSRGDLLVLLNNDVEVISPGWLQELAAYATQEHAGAVGAKLLYPDGRVQHAGIVLDAQRTSSHIHLGAERHAVVARKALQLPQNYLAVTAACLMVNRKKFDAVNGFDPAFRVEYNDLDFCLRLYDKGWYNSVLPQVELYHYESASRRHPHSDPASYRQHRAEAALFRQRWEHYILNDPYLLHNA